MKTIDAVPGDFIEWVYISDNRRVVDDEMLWSTTMYDWVPIQGKQIALLISNVNEIYTWVSYGGLFCAHLNDALHLGSDRVFVARQSMRESRSDYYNSV